MTLMPRSTFASKALSNYEPKDCRFLPTEACVNPATRRLLPKKLEASPVARQRLGRGAVTGFLNLLNALASKEWSVDSKASQDAFALALQAGKAR